MTTPQLSHNLSRYFSSEDVPWHQVGGCWPGVSEGRVLRALDDGSIRSVIVRLPRASQFDTGETAAATVQGFVLSGEITLGQTVVSAWGFFVVLSGGVMPKLTSANGADLLLIFDNAKTARPSLAAPVILNSALDVDPITPVIAGKTLTGFERRVLWEDPDTGADTRLLKVPGGFEGKGPNWHPVHEEIFCLEGDIGPDDERLLTPGKYLHNPAFCVHGYHEHSKGGATILEWHDGPWQVNFTA